MIKRINLERSFLYKCTVLLLDDSEILQCEFDKKETARNLMDRVCDHLNLIERDYFSLCLNEDDNSKRWLEPDKSIIKQVKGVWPLVLRFRVHFYPVSTRRLNDPVTCYQLYLQLRRDLCAGRLVGSDRHVTLLTALILRVDLGGSCRVPPLSDPGSSLRPRSGPLFQYCGYITSTLGAVDPGAVLAGGSCHSPSTDSCCKRTGGGCSCRLQCAVMRAFHRRTCAISVQRAQSLFLRRVCRLDTYGTRLVCVRDQRGGSVLLGSNHRGLSVFRERQRLALLRWSDIDRLNFEDKMFIVHLTSQSGQRARKAPLMAGYKFESKKRCRLFWMDACQQRFFFSCGDGEQMERCVWGGSLLTGWCRVRLSGPTQRQIAAQHTGRKHPLFTRYGPPPWLCRSDTATVLESDTRSVTPNHSFSDDLQWIDGVGGNVTLVEGEDCAVTSPPLDYVTQHQRSGQFVYATSCHPTQIRVAVLPASTSVGRPLTSDTDCIVRKLTEVNDISGSMTLPEYTESLDENLRCTDVLLMNQPKIDSEECSSGRQDGAGDAEVEAAVEDSSSASSSVSSMLPTVLLIVVLIFVFVAPLLYANTSMARWLDVVPLTSCLNFVLKFLIEVFI